MSARQGDRRVANTARALEKLIAEKERELAELKAKLEEPKRLKSLPSLVASPVPVEREQEMVEAGVGA
jgi:hypothetical protein